MVTVGRRLQMGDGRRKEAEASVVMLTRGVVACGTGVGVAIFANKFPGVYAANCLTADEALNARSINNCNFLAVSGMSTCIRLRWCSGGAHRPAALLATDLGRWDGD
ncbi:hypothetical protein CASFOL_042771 [Castilleja foliolosa]|uniref:Uncharacterized protein n=1 Tax=Castilleja foliolosa TaxID=1961234 RepID=A0ABD3B7N6_9LAMI